MVSALQKLDKLKRFFKPGEFVIREGDSSSEFYILIEGDAEVMIGDKRLASITASEGEIFFGEMATILQEPRSASIVAVTKCTVLCVPSDSLVKVLQLSPSILMKLLRQLAHRIKQLNERESDANKSVAAAKSDIEVRLLESKNFVKGILGLVEIMAAKSGDAGLQAIQLYISQNNPLGLRSGSTAHLKMDKVKEAGLSHFFQ